jgi:hypothetical protein
VRLANGAEIQVRNAANTADMHTLSVVDANLHLGFGLAPVGGTAYVYPPTIFSEAVGCANGMVVTPDPTPGSSNRQQSTRRVSVPDNNTTGASDTIAVTGGPAQLGAVQIEVQRHPHLYWRPAVTLSMQAERWCCTTRLEARRTT